MIVIADLEEISNMPRRARKRTRGGTEQISKSEKERLNQIMDGYDLIFRTLIMPATFLSTLTWGFYFFIGALFGPSDLIATQNTVRNFYIPYIAAHLILIAGSAIVWLVSVFARVGEREARFWKWQTHNQSATRFLKRLSLGFLISALLINPALIIVLAMQPLVGPDAPSYYFLIVYLIVMFILSFMPIERIKKKQKRKRS